ncbi:MAG: gliding motility-associated C-terminal domain-containing protein [Vicingaceae bacterium]|nr:gliding motility-associated C-terminal domain-containing protein [Vicingaceae bacterium]
MTKVNFFVLFLFLLISSKSFSQRIFHQDIFYGGVTGAGFSTGLGYGSGSFNVYVDPSSTIKKAYLFSYSMGYPPPTTITLNSIGYLFDTTDAIINFSHINPYVSPVSLHVKDITQDIIPTVSNYSITIPVQSGLPINWGYYTVYLYIEYENLALSKTCSNILINDKDAIGAETYSINNLNPINTNFPVGFAVYSDRMTGTVGGSFFYNVFFNSFSIGNIGVVSDNVNSLWGAACTKGHFYYQNNTLFGLDDDNPNSTMNQSDGLADVSGYLSNNTTSCNFQLIHDNYPNNHSVNTGIELAFFLTYTTPCDTFSTTATALQDTICLGDSVQLQASGGATYSWFGAFGGLSDTSIANPMASPPQTTTYIVTIKNDSGCVKTEHVKIWVTQPIDSITTTPTVCGNTTGTITAHYNTNANYNFTLYDNNFNPLANNTTGVFNQLPEGIYIIENTLHNCAFYDTVTVNATNNVIANFYSFPQAPWNNPNQSLGKAPMEVSFFNASQNANTYLWSITQQPNNDIIIQHSTFNTQHFFTEGGTYEVCLIAYNNQPQCADTSCKTIFIDPNEEISLFIPNVFTPNGDNENDNFVIQLIGTTYLESLEIKVFSRWGQEVAGSKFDVQSLASVMDSSPSGLGAFTVWNGKTTAGNKASEGTYFYVVSYTTKLGETVTQKGTVMLLR